MSLADKDEAERDAIERTLHIHRVHDGFCEQRQALAITLHRHGIKPVDIESLAISIAAQRRKSADPPAAILFAILTDPVKALVRIADIARGNELRKPREAYPGAALFKAPNSPTTAEGDTEPDSWLQDDFDRRVLALHRSDRRGAAQIAEDLQCPIAEVNLVLQRHKTAIDQHPKTRRHANGAPPSEVSPESQSIAEGRRNPE